jgi:DNA-binding response OmpR family regulator
MPKRILVAEDDPGIGEMLHEMLLDAGYEAEIEMNGQAGRAADGRAVP